jgi:hypothetical protein
VTTTGRRNVSISSSVCVFILFSAMFFLGTAYSNTVQHKFNFSIYRFCLSVVGTSLKLSNCSKLEGNKASFICEFGRMKWFSLLFLGPVAHKVGRWLFKSAPPEPDNWFKTKGILQPMSSLSADLYAFRRPNICFMMITTRYSLNKHRNHSPSSSCYISFLHSVRIS